ncbi:MAG: KEOPS complex subunit Pcc1 [Candidatus Bathyarchaeia archaeon]
MSSGHIARVEISCLSEKDAVVLVKALIPDIVDMKRKTGARLKRFEDVLVLILKGESIPSLRASVNTYLRLASAVGQITKLLDDMYIVDLNT